MMILLPHGGYPLIPATISMMAWISALSQDGCDFAVITGQGVKQLLTTSQTIITTTASTMDTLSNEIQYHPPFVEMGFLGYRFPSFYPEVNEWRTRYTDSCLSFPSLYDEQQQQEEEEGAYYKSGLNEGTSTNTQPEYEFRIPDGYMTFGRDMHTTATIFGGATSFLLWVISICIPFSERDWKIVSSGFMIASFFELCSLFWFSNRLCNEDYTTCHFFYGADIVIVSFFLYLVSFYFMLTKYPEPKVSKFYRKRMEEDLSQVGSARTKQQGTNDNGNCMNSLLGGGNISSRFGSSRMSADFR